MTTTATNSENAIPELPEGIDFWDCDEGQECLTNHDIHDAIEYHLDGMWERGQEWASYKSYLPEKLTVYGWKRIKVTADMLYEPLDDVLERLDEEYGDPDGDGADATEKMKEAQKVFLEAVAAEYSCWACEQVAKVEVDPAAWIEQNRPDWMEDK